MHIKIKRLRTGAVLPEYQTEGAAAMDVSACLDTQRTIEPFERVVIPTGIAIELPVGYEAQLRARSGLSLKHGICLANGIGTIDSDYRGEVGVILINLGNESFIIEQGMRIAQMVVSRHEKVKWNEIDSLSDTIRGENGYGSTNIK